MKSALIGYTGFVGKNLDRQFTFDDKYNSKNINKIEGKKYDIVVCSGIPASMWVANNFPEKDLENIENLLKLIKTINVKQFVLISSTAVFTPPIKNINEDSQSFETKIAYGKNRCYAEKVIADTFNDSYIIRLPALFGDGLEKNFIYDLLNQEPAFMLDDQFKSLLDKICNVSKQILNKYYNFNAEKKIYSFNKIDAIADNKREEVLSALKEADFTALKFTHSESIFQFYNLDNLWWDINIALDKNLRYLNISSEPIKAAKIAKQFFNIDFNNDTGRSPFDYDMHSKYAKYWGKSGNYQYSQDDIIDSLEKFFK